MDPLEETEASPALVLEPAKELALPEKLAEILDALGSQTSYTVTISRLHEATGRYAQVGQMKRLPDPDEIGKLYGGGEYRLVVQWRRQGTTMGRLFTRSVDFVLDAAYTDRANAERAAKLHGEGGDSLEKILAVAERIAGMNRGGGASGGDAIIAATVERLMDRIDRMQERNDDRFATILEEMRRSQTAQPHPLTTWRESMEFAKEMGLPVMAAGDGDKRETWVEVVDIVANNVGKFLEMMTEAQKSNLAKMRLMANPMARKVVTQGGKAMQDPATREKMIAMLTEKVGKETTDKILQGLEGKP